MTDDHLDMQSPDLVNANFDKLAALFPNCVTESADGKAIDFDLLKQELNHAVVEGNKERYRLEWPGKREAIVTANLPTTKTLRPIREDSVDFDNTENIYIEGDNLEVLKLLQESYLGKIKMIYIDPPYNTGNDFVYKDNFTSDKEVELFESGQKDEYKQRLVANPESSGRYHSDWLSMMYPRLKLARNLLSQNGAIFISIDDVELNNLYKLCEDIFGSNAHLATLLWKSRQTTDSRKKTNMSVDHEYIVVFTKGENFSLLGKSIDQEKYRNPDNDLRGPWASIDLSVQATKDQRPNQFYNIIDPETGFTYPANPQRVWSKSKSVVEEMIKEKRILFPDKREGRPREKKFLSDLRSNTTGFTSWLDPKQAGYTTNGTREFSSLFDERIFDFPKPTSLLDLIINQGLTEDGFFLDFFSGSASSAHSVLKLNVLDGITRKYIMVQLPESTASGSTAFNNGFTNICEIGKERIRRAGKSIMIDKLAKVEEKKAGLEKLVNGQVTMVDGIWTLPENIIVDEAAESLLQEINDLQYSADHLDIGFRVYRLDDSNMQDVYYRPQDYKQTQLDAFADNVKPDRSADDLLAQIMLDWGLPLSLKIEQITIAGKHVYKVAENSLYACFDRGIDEAFAKEIAKDQPLRIVFRDNGFIDDTAKTNVKQLIKQLSPETEMKVI